MPRLLEPSRPGADLAAAIAGVEILDPPPLLPPAEGIGAEEGTETWVVDMKDEQRVSQIGALSARAGSYMQIIRAFYLTGEQIRLVADALSNTREQDVVKPSKSNLHEQETT